jgi:hypothetical protein
MIIIIIIIIITIIIETAKAVHMANTPKIIGTALCRPYGSERVKEKIVFKCFSIFSYGGHLVQQTKTI